MSKRYPVIKRWIDGIPVNRPKDVGVEGGSYQIDHFYGNLSSAKWIHVNKDVLSVARKDADKLLGLPLNTGGPVVITFNKKGASSLVFMCDGLVHAFRNSSKEFDGKGIDLTSLNFSFVWREGGEDHVSDGQFSSNISGEDLSITIDYVDNTGQHIPKSEREELGSAAKVAIAAMLLTYNVIPKKREARRMHAGGIRCKYEKLNDLPINVDFINIGRLSGTSKGKPFSVAGHPRLQRVGKGLKSVKVVWVKSHVRSGRSTKPYVDR